MRKSLPSITEVTSDLCPLYVNAPQEILHGYWTTAKIAKFLADILAISLPPFRPLFMWPELSQSVSFSCANWSVGHTS